LVNKYKKIAVFLIIRRLIIAFSLLLSACSVVPIYTVDNAVYVSVNGNVTLEQAKEAIINAGNKRKWQMEEVKPGHLAATLHVRKHKIIVDIKYNTNAFSIIYKDSINMKFDGLYIHPKYNNWIQNLQNDINDQFDNM